MRLLYITTVPMSLTFLRAHVGFAKRQGMDVHVVSSPGPLLDSFSEETQVSAWGVSMPRRITPLGDLRAVYRIWHHLRHIHPHILHAHTPKGGLLGMIAASLAGVPVRIYHIHGLPLITATGLRRLLLWLSEWVSCHLAHQVLCVSTSIRKIAVEMNLCPPEHIDVLGNGSISGVDAEGRFNPAHYSRSDVRRDLNIPGDAMVLGYVGRVVRDKGIEELVRTWQELRQKWDDLHLLVIGPFEPQDPVSPDIEQLLHTDERVHLRGWVGDVTSLYAAMDLVVLPTYREGFPVVPLEAAAMALPVVATRVPGCIDAVEDGVTGTLVPPRDAEALTSAIQRYLQDKELRRRHGQAGRERALRDFRPEDIWQAMFEQYARLLEEKGLAAPADHV